MTTRKLYIGTNEALTPMEKQVLTKLAVGKMQKEIIRELALNKSELGRILKSILRKSGAVNPCAAVFVAAKENLI